MGSGRAVLPLALVVGMVLTGCSSGASSRSPGSPSSSGSVGPVSATASAGVSGSLSLVGLGDSIPGALACDGCKSYVELYGEAASKALRKPVTVTNLATNDGLESLVLLGRIRTDKEHIDGLRAADLITLQIGFNDWQGRCGWPDGDACLAEGSANVESNLAAILDEISKLRDGRPSAIRVLTYYNMFRGDLTAPEPAYLADPAFQTYYAKQLKTFDSMICRVAGSKRATCVDLVPAFNGPAGDKNAGSLVGPDNKHPTQAGHERIATAIAAAGFAPLE